MMNMTENPYAAPRALLIDAEISQPSIPVDVSKNIKNAWVAASISGLITLVFTLLAIFGHSILGFSAWELIDAVLVFGLAFGIYKKSRTCALLMLIYFVIAKILLMTQAGAANGILLALVFLYYFAMGVKGTFDYHRILAAHRLQHSNAGA